MQLLYLLAVAASSTSVCLADKLNKVIAYISAISALGIVDARPVFSAVASRSFNLCTALSINYKGIRLLLAISGESGNC